MKKTFITTIAVATLSLLPISIAYADTQSEIDQQRQEIKNDRELIKHEKQQIREDEKKIREEKREEWREHKHGKSTGTTQTPAQDEGQG